MKKIIEINNDHILPMDRLKNHQLLGELNPTTELVTLCNVSHMVTNIELSDSNSKYKLTIETLNTPKGKILEDLFAMAVDINIYPRTDNLGNVIAYDFCI